MARPLSLLILLLTRFWDGTTSFTTSSALKAYPSTQETSFSDVDALLDRIKGRRYSDMTPEERDDVTCILQRLEGAGSKDSYLDDTSYVGDDDDDVEKKEAGGTTKLLWDSYELTYFDRSIDRGGSGRTTGQEDRYKNATRPFGIRSKVLGKLFGLRYSFQHAIRPNVLVNDVGFHFCGLPAAVVARGTFTRLNQTDVNTVKNDTGTTLRGDTAIRIDFEAPVLWFGLRKFPLVFRLGAKAQSPPVTLCTTYVDERVRTALAAKGGRLVFTRGGKALEGYAKDWETIVSRKALPGAVLGGAVLAALGMVASLVPAARIPFGLVLVASLFAFVKGKLSSGGKKQQTATA